MIWARRIAIAIASLGAACGVDDTPPPRSHVASVALASTGISEPVDFTVPMATRSVTVVVVGAPESLYGLASLRTPDGVELVGVDLARRHGAEMEASYYTEQIGLMPGRLYQSVRLGTFTHVYPYAPGQAVPPGRWQLRVASNASGGTVAVTLLFPEDDGAKVLHVNLVAASETLVLAQAPPFVAAWQTIFDAAGIRLVVDDVIALPGTGMSQITDSSEPQETPTSQTAKLASLGGGQVKSTAALNVFVVDGLPAGVGGLSLGTPGPPVPSSYYYGIVARRSSNPSALARTIAHEVAHFLALQHVSNVGASGMAYPDPIADTMPGSGNLMENGIALTPGQTFALTRSALLRLE